MSETTGVEDPLKPPDQVDQPDERSASFLKALADRHAELAAIRLLEGVPTDVAQLFETAKNVSLYSWYVYRFHQVAEAVAFQALEAGLRMRCHEDRTYKGGGKLSSYLRHAEASGWLGNRDFDVVRRQAVARAQIRAVIGQIQQMQGAGPTPVLPPTEEDIERELTEMTYVKNLINAIPTHRNELAHGSGMLMPNSARTLRLVAELLNAVFGQVPTAGE